MTSLAKDIACYENWLREQCRVVEADLEAKHERMRESPFDFLCATPIRARYGSSKRSKMTYRTFRATGSRRWFHTHTECLT